MNTKMKKRKTKTKTKTNKKRTNKQKIKQTNKQLNEQTNKQNRNSEKKSISQAHCTANMFEIFELFRVQIFHKNYNLPVQPILIPVLEHRVLHIEPLAQSESSH